MLSRIRTIKPSFFKHESLFDAEEETGLPLRLAFAGLWTITDREGRFEWRPRMIKTDVLPYDSVDFTDVLDALARYGFVVRYEVDGKPYGYIPSWSKHQTINTREAASVLPAPAHDDPGPEGGKPLNAQERTCMHVHAEGEGKERKGKERECSGACESPEIEPDQPGEPDFVPAGASTTAQPDSADPSDGKPNHCPIQKIVDAYHEILPELPGCRAMPEGRRKYIQQRWREHPSVEHWRRYFRYVRDCPWPMGRCEPMPGRQVFVADLEWLMRPGNYTKVIEGKYEDQGQQRVSR